MSLHSMFATLRQERAVVPKRVVFFAKLIFTLGWMTLFGMIVLNLIRHFFTQGADGLVTFSVESIALAIGGTFLAGYLMLLGYVYGDARRRGMPPGLWTLLVALIPNLIGFVVYFILRRQIFAPCPQCGRGAGVGQMYCSACGHKLDLAAA